MTALATFTNLCTAIGQNVLARWDAFIGPYRPKPDPDDEPPATVATWTCPDCHTDVPVALRTEHVYVMSLDTLDIRAHVLTHEGA